VCSQEFPDIESDVHLTYRGQGLTVLGVATGGFDESEATLDAFAEQTAVTFPIVHDSATYQLFSWPPALSPFPRQVLIDRDGVVRYLASEHRPAELDAAIREVLGLSR